MKSLKRMRTMLVLLAVCGACTNDKQELVSKDTPPGEVAAPEVVAAAPAESKPSVMPTPAPVAAPTPAPTPVPEVAAVAPKPQDTLPPTAAGSIAGVEIKRVVFTKGVADREPMDTATSFSHAQTPKVWVFLELANNTPDTLTLDVSWQNPEGKAGHPVQLTVPTSKRWRTQSFTSTDKKPGTYRCIVRSADGTVLVDQSIDITA